MEWVFAHMEDADFNDPLPPPGSEPAAAGGGGGGGGGDLGLGEYSKPKYKKSVSFARGES